MALISAGGKLGTHSAFYAVFFFPLLASQLQKLAPKDNNAGHLRDTHFVPSTEQAALPLPRALRTAGTALAREGREDLAPPAVRQLQGGPRTPVERRRLRTHLHGADAEAPVNHELAEGGRALVAVTAVHHEQPAEMLELSDGEVRGQGGLFSLLKANEIRHRQKHEKVKANTFFFFLIEKARHCKEIFEELQ